MKSEQLVVSLDSDGQRERQMNDSTKLDMDANDPELSPVLTTEPEEVSSPQQIETIGETQWIPQDDPVEEWPIIDADAGLVYDDETPQADSGNIGSGFFNRKEEGDWKETVVGKTIDGKNVVIKKRLEGIGYTINVGKSQTPKELDGMFTTYSIAEREARLYLAKQRDNAKIASK